MLYFSAIILPSRYIQPSYQLQSYVSMLTLLTENVKEKLFMIVKFVYLSFCFCIAVINIIVRQGYCARPEVSVHGTSMVVLMTRGSRKTHPGWVAYDTFRHTTSNTLWQYLIENVDITLLIFRSSCDLRNMECSNS